jgi:hypothetical protein
MKLKEQAFRNCDRSNHSTEHLCDTVKWRPAQWYLQVLLHSLFSKTSIGINPKYPLVKTKSPWNSSTGHISLQAQS